MNSFVGDRHPLVDIDEFSGRLRAVKDTVADDLVLVARIEALIAGHGMDETLLRASAYAAAGADAILIHSRKSTADEILSFASSWQNRRPVVIVPTKYYQTPISTYRDAGIRLIYDNRLSSTQQRIRSRQTPVMHRLPCRHAQVISHGAFVWTTQEQPRVDFSFGERTMRTMIFLF